MNPTKAAMNKIAEGIYELADAMFQDAAGATQTPYKAPDTITLSTGAGMPEPSPFVDLPDEVFRPTAEGTPQEHARARELAAEHGSLAQCPSHRAKYLSGKYGFYCPARSEDPAWANKKGYCTITPENAAEWLRITAA